MKLLVICPFPPTKGPEAEKALILCQHLADWGVDVRVVTRSGSSASNHAGVTVYPILREWSYVEFPRLARFMSQCAPEAILLMYIDWFYNNSPLITFLPTIAKKVLPATPFVTLFEDICWLSPLQRPLLSAAFHGQLKQWAGPRRVNEWYGTLLSDSDRLIVVSERIKAKLAVHWNDLDRKTAVIPSPPLIRICPEDGGATRQKRRQALGVNPEDFLLVYFGYMYHTKGIETLLEAFARASAYRNNVRLLFVGGSLQLPDQWSDYGQEIRELTEHLGIEDKVLWTGEYASDSSLPSSCLHAADICVLPYDMGICIHNCSFAAAAAHGLPVITTRGKTLEEQFIDQENVFLCPPKDSEALAAAIEELLDNPDLCARLRNGVLRLADEWFSWERATERTLATLAPLDSASPAAPA